ncbi:AMP-binding protein [Novosphingobium album (ex Hu et al. 2023)]|uniref:AMP-binding protein n=1 Tax=Novosphingobium album (ex Hu et al. 2023) TaxID=2930093 RepID=A0ABT0B0J2_9SPHN|nr:AMP-binding protein [Novosphingobium album (ex Hu et al. 2023)]MCJ2178581.1 AMP-binding protein [Novosphingobium album (ex Hu et al. 2023)]
MAGVVLGDLPERNAARRGADHWAVRHGDAELSWGDLADAATRRARALQGLGVGQGDRVVLSMPNGNAFFEWTFAVWKLGATPTVVSHRLPAPEFTAILDLAEPRAAVVEDEALRASCRGLPVAFGRDHPDGSPLASLVAPSWKAMTSGGSTGRPKLIVDHHPSQLDDSVRGLGIPVDGVMLNAGPLYHNFPFAMSHSVMVHGNSVVGMERFDAGEFLRLVEAHKVQWTALVPTMMNRVARLPEQVRARYDISSLETLWHTAAPITPELKQFWIDWIGPEKVWEMYGGTEGFATTQLNGVEWLAHRGSVGRPTWSDVLVRGEDGAVLRPGEVGEIYMRRIGTGGGDRSYHYLGADSRRLPDGFESFGDYGWVDEDGYLYIADRRTDLIISGGRNLYPAEIEAALMAHPDVLEAIVIGLPDEDLGARVHAIVRLAEGAEAGPEDLLPFVRGRLVSYKVPRTIEFTEAPLRDEAGKARRSALRAERI